MTANSFSSLSLIPPLVLVCLRSASSSAGVIAHNRTFAINVLSADQEMLGRRFASSARLIGRASFVGVPHRTEATGAPILEGTAGWLDCRLVAMPPAGDHVIVIGEILDFASDRAREPLLFHAGRYRVVGDREDRPPAPNLFPVPPLTWRGVNQ